jgi:hypothetical protein
MALEALLFSGGDLMKPDGWMNWLAILSTTKCWQLAPDNTIMTSVGYRKSDDRGISGFIKRDMAQQSHKVRQHWIGRFNRLLTHEGPRRTRETSEIGICELSKEGVEP